MPRAFNQQLLDHKGLQFPPPLVHVKCSVFFLFSEGVVFHRAVTLSPNKGGCGIGIGAIALNASASAPSDEDAVRPESTLCTLPIFGLPIGLFFSATGFPQPGVRSGSPLESSTEVFDTPPLP